MYMMHWLVSLIRNLLSRVHVHISITFYTSKIKSHNPTGISEVLYIIIITFYSSAMNKIYFGGGGMLFSQAKCVIEHYLLDEPRR